MNTIGQFSFPDTPEEAREWRQEARHMPLASDVIAVAVTRIEGSWTAYIGAVPGERHSDEWQNVLVHGAKLHEEIAAVIFPQFKDIPYAR